MTQKHLVTTSAGMNAARRRVRTSKRGIGNTVPGTAPRDSAECTPASANHSRASDASAFAS